MVLSVKDLLRKLVEIPSVNPAFSPANTAHGGEGRITDFLENFFQGQGMPWARQRVHEGRDNIVAVCHPDGVESPDSPVLWEVHQDTVGVAGMKIDPFAGSESDGRIWGRGACDVKGGMAAMLSAISQLHEAGKGRSVVLACTINEECGFSGVKALCRLWAGNEPAGELRGPLSLQQLRALRPGRAIVAEPTSLDVVVAHKGGVRWRCHTHGRAAHTSRPEQGVNAISSMVRVVQTIEQFDEDVLRHRPPHPLCGRSNVCVSTIQGGSGVNTVPDHAVIDIDRRLMPGETPEDAYAELVEYVAANTSDCDAAIEHEAPLTKSVGLEDHNNRDWGAEIATAVQQIGCSSQLVGVPYGTDAWALSAAGIPTVVFGPGSIDQAHTDDEWIEIQQLEQAAKILYRLGAEVSD